MEGALAIEGSQEPNLLTIVAFGPSLWLIICVDRKREGFFVNGRSSKRATAAIILSAVVGGSDMIALTWADALFRWSLTSLAVAAIVFVGYTLASRWWELLSQSELQEAANSRLVR